MATPVVYELNLKDNLSAGISGANSHVNQLEKSLGSVKSGIGSVTGMLGTLGVGFAIFKGAEFIHEGIEAFHALEQVTAKVEANLESTGEKAGLSMGDITTMAKTLSSQVQFGRAEIMDMQSQLLTFPIYKKEWDKMQKFAIISCFDSTKNTRHPNLKELQDSTPDLVITIGYSGNPAIDSNLSNYTKPTYVSITCHFYSKGFDIDFGLLVKFIKKDIPMIRKKYARSIIG